MLWAKLLDAQKSMRNPVKDKTAKGKAFSYNYADLAQVLTIVLQALHANGLGLIQSVTYTTEGVPYLVTTVFDSEESQELSRRRLHDFTDAQAQGSGLTYTRRYELLTVFGLAASDEDDGFLTKQTQEMPRDLQQAQGMLLQAEKTYCWRNGIADVNQFHQDILCREDYRNDTETLTRIAMELMSDVG